MLGMLLISCVSDVSDPAVPPAPDPKPLLDPGQTLATYEVSFPEVHAHRVEVSAATTCPEAGVATWWMPVWTPGSYLVREFARHIERIEGVGPQGAVPTTKVAKNRWEVTCIAGQPTGVVYTLYARTLSVRESFVDQHMGILNGAATFLLPKGPTDQPLDLRFVLPSEWSRIDTALPRHPDGEDHHFLAPNVDTLIDAPVILGNPAVRSFEVQGVPHHLVTLGEAGPWDHDRAVADVQRVTETIVDFWGAIPYPEYHYLNVLAETGGGLEHLNSTLMMTSRWNLVRREDRLRWLGLVSHEFFHTWNVKRLRPAGLGPFDYEREVHTRLLWVAEGITSYYDDLLLARAGLMTEDEYLDRLTQNIGRVQERPGRRVQPLSEASFDAWIKHYRRDENTPNSTVSYYTKGSVVGFLLDAEIRRASRDHASLDDVLRVAWSRHSKEGFSPEEFRSIASEQAGTDLSEFFAATVDRTDELDFGGALQWWGLRFAPPPDPDDTDEPVAGWLGANVGSVGGRLMVQQVRRGTPAFDAGLNVGDELLAIDDERVTEATIDKRLNRLGADRVVELLVARRGRIRRLAATLGELPRGSRWRVEPDPGASPLADRRRARWLSPE